MKTVWLVLLIVSCELVVHEINAQGVFSWFRRTSSTSVPIQTFTAYGPPQTLYVTDTLRETLYVTETLTQVETTTETEWFSWVRWMTETETLRLTHTLTSTSTTVDVSLLVSVAVVTLTEKTTKTAISTLTSVDTTTLTTTLFFDRTIWSAQTMNSCMSVNNRLTPMAPELRSDNEEEVITPTATLLKMESTEIPAYAVRRVSLLESSFSPLYKRHRLTDATDYPIVSSMESAHYDANEY